MKDKDRGKSDRGNTKKKSKGFSVLPEDAIETGLFASGPATIKESIYAMYDYGGSSKPVPVWLIVYSRDGEEDYEQPYSLGKGWKVSKDGSELIALNAQTGLPKSCNAMKYLVRPLYEALEAADLDPTDYLTNDPTDLDGLDVIVQRVDQEKRDIKDSKGKRRSDDKERTILTIEEVVEQGKKSSGKKKAKDEDEDDEDSDEKDPRDDEDEEEDEKPKKKKKPARDDDEDDEDEKSDDEDEDDEKPAKGKKSAKKSKDEDEDEDNELDEEAGEAIVTALEAAEGPIRIRDLDEALSDALKGNPQRKALVAHATSEAFLEKETSWEYNGKQIEAK